MPEEAARLLRWRNEAALPLIADIRISAHCRDDTGDKVGQRRPEGAEWQHEPGNVVSTTDAAGAESYDVRSGGEPVKEGSSVAEGCTGASSGSS